MLQVKQEKIFTVFILIAAAAVLSSCQVQDPEPVDTPQPTSTPTPIVSPTPIPSRPAFAPGELVDYEAQTGDTLPTLADRFNTTEDQILKANPVIPDEVTTLPAGLPLKIPIYYEPLWGTAFKILPNSLFINGPAQRGFDATSFINAQDGWLKDHNQLAAGRYRSGAEIVEYISKNFSISPQLLLILLEYQTQALTNPVPPDNIDLYPLGHEEKGYEGLHIQLVWAANTLNQGYYGWLTGQVETLEHPDGTIEHPDPWQNAATVALQYYFSQIMSHEAYDQAVGPEGYADTFLTYFPDPWDTPPHIPGSLTQPSLRLPFEDGETWAYTGGPHTGWGKGQPWAALDFAPPGVAGGCEPSKQWAVASANGVVARSEDGVVELDLDGDGDPRTGWVLFYLHIGSSERVSAGVQLETGDPLGHPSCEGGESTGTHIHMARKYNGEWIPAGGIIPFNLGGWVAHNGEEEYKGTMTHFQETVIASENAEYTSFLKADN
ncbi:MAG: LysM peptidoglycan-binding domain-containing protein [Anaerolineales bacterium]|nr:LysM peptidoglycan-binding domain-containing protein [Anaerolineales bacterium]